MNSLKRLDWREELDRLSSKFITSSSTDNLYSSGEIAKVEYQINTIKKIYMESAKWGNFSVDAILCDVEDHDYEICEEMAAVIMGNCISDEDKADDTYEDMKANIIDELAVEYDICIFIDFPATNHSSMPYIVSRELSLNKWYYSIQTPPFGSYEEYCGQPKQLIEYNDCQNVLLPNMIQYESVYDIIDDNVINVPIKIKPVIRKTKKIGGENYGNIT